MKSLPVQQVADTPKTINTYSTLRRIIGKLKYLKYSYKVSKSLT